MGALYKVNESGQLLLYPDTGPKTIIINDGTNEVSILIGTDDPTSVATDADIGSLYLNTDAGGIYYKTDDGSSTNWIKSDDGGSLDESYDFGGAGAGKSITADSGAVSIEVPDNSGNVVLDITQSDITNNPYALSITNSGTGYSLFVDHNGASGQAVQIESPVEEKIRINDGTDSFSIFTGTATPTSTSKNADIGSIYINTSDSTIYKKNDDGDSTDWVSIDRTGFEHAFVTDTGAADAMVAEPGVYDAGLTSGVVLFVEAANDNTGATTINVDGAGATAIKDRAGNDLIAGDILSGEVISLVYDGTYWRLIGYQQRTYTTALNLPIWTTATRPPDITGTIGFNTTTSEFEGYNGSTWATLG